MPTNNAISNTSNPLASTAVTIDPGASGDSFVQFNINTTSEFRIGVDDTDDSFRISQGSALGTNDTFIMTAAGERTMPLQPAFLAYLPSTDADVTGDNTFFVVGSVTAMTEVFDQGGDFATSTFTAPVTGRYLLSGNVTFTEIGVTHTDVRINITTSNRVIQFLRANATLMASSGDLTMLGSSASDMDAADTANIQGFSGNSTKTVDVVGDANLSSSFGAYLIC